MKHHKCPSELLRGFLSNFKVYLEEYIVGTRFNAISGQFRLSCYRDYVFTC